MTQKELAGMAPSISANSPLIDDFGLTDIRVHVAAFVNPLTANQYLHLSSQQRRERTRLTFAALQVGSEQTAPIVYTAEGKPQIENGAVSASHKGSLTAVAVSSGHSVGIDLETISSRHPDFVTYLAVSPLFAAQFKHSEECVAAYWSCLESVWKCSQADSMSHIRLLQITPLLFQVGDGRMYRVYQQKIHNYRSFISLAVQV